MKLKVLLVGLAAAMLCVSAAVAAPPADKGKPPTTGEGCKPKVTVVLKGTLKGAPLSVDVTSGIAGDGRTSRALRRPRSPSTRRRRCVVRARSHHRSRRRRPRARPGEGCARPTSRKCDAASDGLKVMAHPAKARRRETSGKRDRCTGHTTSADEARRGSSPLIAEGEDPYRMLAAVVWPGRDWSDEVLRLALVGCPGCSGEAQCEDCGSTGLSITRLRSARPPRAPAPRSAGSSRARGAPSGTILRRLRSPAPPRARGSPRRR